MGSPDRLTELTSRINFGALAAERTIAVHRSLHGLLPNGLTRGSTLGCSGSSALSSAFLVAAEASQQGAWVGVAGLPVLGLQACREAGVLLERLVVVRGNGYGDAGWGSTLAALIDGFDIVMFGAASELRAGTSRRLQARLHTRGSVMVVVGDPGPISCDVQMSSTANWHGIGEGHGYLRSREVLVTVEGRRIPRPRTEVLWMPDHDGVVRSASEMSSAAGTAHHSVAEDTAAIIPLRRTG